MDMEYYVISPNVENKGAEVENYLDTIYRDHVALMGWSADTDKGKMFAGIRKGDRIVIARGANYNKRVYAVGVADSECDASGWPLEIHLSPFIQGEGRLSEAIPFSTGCAYGGADRIPAIYRLHESNEADKEIMKAVEDMIASERMIAQLRATGNIVLHGAPGTGKTYRARKAAGQMNASVGFVQFHPSYDYTDFVEGLRPVRREEGPTGQIGFERKDGIFKAFCKKALAAPGKDFVFIIDEINRGDLSKIFGELFFAIDPGYRGEEGRIGTQYQNLVEKGDEFEEGFYVPGNVYVIGTMNDIDRSVESMDFAMRRRFAFIEITAEESQAMLVPATFRGLVKEGDADEAVARIGEMKKRMNALNKAIAAEGTGLSRDYQIGAAYFLKYALYAKESDAFGLLWDNHLKSVLTEYLRGTGDEDSKLERLKDAYDNAEAQDY